MVKSAQANELEYQISSLPRQTGVYLFHDQTGQIIYVGKAKDIRSRVRSHFTRKDRWGQEMLQRIYSIDCLVFSNETEALLAEQNLIKTNQPRYNILLKDGHSYPWIVLSTDQEYPRLYLSREQHVPGRRYFGPYTSSRQAGMIVDLLNRTFRLRSCTGVQPGRKSGSPCLDYHIGRCSAPCFDGGKSQAAYQKDIQDALACLQGGYKTLQEKLQQEMQKASGQQKYEKAAVYRDLLSELEKLTARQRVAGLPRKPFDLVALAGDREGQYHVQLWRVRHGLLEAKLGFYLHGESGQEVLAAFLEQYYLDSSMLPSEIIVPAGYHPEAQQIATSLFHLHKKKVQIQAAPKGRKGELWQTAQRNAELALQRDQLGQELQRQKTHQELTQLQQALGMETIPRRIECYDASHLMGTHTYVSMSVLQDGQPCPKEYRVFKIEDQAGSPDDFLSLKTALQRRMKRLQQDLSPHDPKWDKSFSQQPNLVLIDGGPGQLDAARKAIGDSPIPLAAIAKKEEQIFLDGKTEPLELASSHPGLMVLQRARDEAHRFALKHHRLGRDKAATMSVLDQLKGVGPFRKKLLLDQFGTAQNVSNASLQELQEVLPAKLAQSVWNQLQLIAP